MRAHDRTDHNDSAVSNELFWSLAALAIVVVCAVLGTLLGELVS